MGEIRGEEAIDLLQAWNTGHDGSMGTAHANSSRDMISRVETMVLMGMTLPLEAIRRQIASGIDLMVHLGRLPDKSRRVLEITEVLGFEEGEVKLETLFGWGYGCGKAYKAGRAGSPGKDEESGGRTVILEKKKNRIPVRPDYDRCRMSFSDRIRCVGQAVLICCCLNYFCYRSVWAIPALLHWESIPYGRAGRLW